MKLLDRAHKKNYPSDITLGIADISDEVSEGLFSDVEKREYESFKNKGRKAEYASARRLFWFLVNKTGIEKNGLNLLKEEGGKPYALAGNNRIHVSFSHSPQKVFCALSSKSNIGLDVEHLSRTISPAVLNRIRHQQEAKIFKLLEPVQLWTIKEAVVKCMGSGLRTNLNELLIEEREKNCFSISFNNESLFEICSFKQSDHQIALAYQGQPI
jgi:phosphopantetheinyl transferase